MTNAGMVFRAPYFAQASAKARKLWERILVVSNVCGCNVKLEQYVP